MKDAKPKNVAASVRARLMNYSKEHGEDFQLVLTRYAIERFLYRLSVSDHRRGFVLKGAMLFQLWADVPHRATRDLDLLGRDDNSVERLASVMKEVVGLPVPDDGLTFDPNKLSAERIREDQEYEGVRILCDVRLGQARIALQIDIGFGDAITPRPTNVQFPTLLEFPPPKLIAYPKETVISEKFQAMVALGLGNSRMKDFFDLWVLAREFDFQGADLSRAVEATFRRRKTPLPVDLPVAITPSFGADPNKKKQWDAFLRRARLNASDAKLEEVCAFLQEFLTPVTRTLLDGNSFTLHWPAGGTWR